MKKCMVVLFVLCCSGCGVDKASEDVQTKSENIEKLGIRVNMPILDTQLDALEKAKSVQNTLNETAKARDKVMREQGI